MIDARHISQARTRERSTEVCGEDAVVYARLARQHRWWTDRPFVREALSLGVRSGCALDVGCGPGYVAVYLARYAPELKVWALDISPDMLDMTAQNAADAGLSERIVPTPGDMCRLPFPDQRFDLVISQYALHHLANPRIAISEMLRVLKPGGSLLVRDLLRPCSNWRIEFLVRFFGTILGYGQAGKQQYRDSLLAGLDWKEVCSLDGKALVAERRALSRFVVKLEVKA